MRATVTVDVDIKHARTALRMAGFHVDDKSDEEICEMAIKRNDCYAVDTQEITWDDTKEIYSGKEALDILNEIRDLAKGESIEVPMVYGDGTEVCDKMISLTKLGYILSEMEIAVKKGTEEDIIIKQEEHDL